MKLIITTLAILLSSMGAYAQFDLKGILGAGSSSSQGSGSTAGSVGNVLGGLVDALTGNKDIKVEDLVGTWVYSSPAVTFESSNALQKFGGAAATSLIEEKMAPYYKTAGLDQLVLTINNDHTFTMKAKFGTVSGVVEKSEKDGLVFNFKAFKKVNLGKVKTQASKSMTGLTITFDVSRLKTVITKVASLSNNQSVKSLSSLLGSYDGIYAGFKLVKK